MPLRFDEYHERDDERRKPPPNYFSRRQQYRLMTLVAALLVLAVIMDRARDPQIYRNFFRAVGAPLPEPEAGQPDAVQIVPGVTLPDEAPARPDVPTLEMPARERPDPPIFNHPDRARRSAAESSPPTDDPILRARREGWRQIRDALDRDARETLGAALDAAIYDQPLDAALRERWAEVLVSVDSAWNDYVREAREAVDGSESSLSDPERQAWREVLAQVTAYWTEQAEPALRAVGSAEPLTAEQRATLVELQHGLLELAVLDIRDNMRLRPAEANAWFSLLNILKQVDQSALHRNSLGPVSYLELYKQPEVYRGRLVTIRGQARMAYHVRAPTNPYGIAGYYVFTIKPADGSRSPIIVYSLELPPGFPTVKDRDVDKETTELKEDLEFTGYAFKRWVYRSRSGIDLAPLILAKSPDWRPRPIPPNGNDLPSATFVIGIVLFCAVAGISIAVWVYRQGQTPREPAKE